MPVIRTTGTPRHGDNISPAALVLAQVIASAAHSWTAQALCGQTDPGLFFSDSAGEIEQAKAICNRCDVRAQCLSHVLDAGEAFGVWGGLDPDERRRLLRRRNAGASQSTGAV